MKDSFHKIGVLKVALSGFKGHPSGLLYPCNHIERIMIIINMDIQLNM